MNQPVSKAMLWILATLSVSMGLVLAAILIFPPFTVIGDSMSPTLHSNQKIYINPFDDIERGDIVIAYNPRHKGNIVKRVIATGGDTVIFHRDEVYVNGNLLDERGIISCQYTEDLPAVIYVPRGSVFLLGDNRPESSDSRVFGVVSTDLIRGVMF